MIMKIVYNCDYCKATIRPMHIGLIVKSVPGATDLGDWRGVESHFCSVPCMVDYAMEHYPRKETVHHQRGKVGVRYFLKAVKDGVYGKVEVMQVINQLAQTISLYKVMRVIQDEGVKIAEAKKASQLVGETGELRRKIEKVLGAESVPGTKVDVSEKIKGAGADLDGWVEK